MSFYSLDPNAKVNIVKSEQALSEEEERRGGLFYQHMPTTSAPAALKHDFGYSYRDIEKLSKGKATQHHEKDALPAVKQLVKQLVPMSYSKVRRIVKRHVTRDSGVKKESVEIVSTEVSFPATNVKRNAD